MARLLERREVPILPDQTELPAMIYEAEPDFDYEPGSGNQAKPRSRFVSILISTAYKEY